MQLSSQLVDVPSLRRCEILYLFHIQFRLQEYIMIIFKLRMNYFRRALCCKTEKLLQDYKRKQGNC